MWEYNYSITNDELYHFGVPGMKWGHRKNYSTIANGSASYAVRRKKAGVVGAMYKSNAKYYNNRADKLSRKASRNQMIANLNKKAANNGNGLLSKANSLNAKYYQNRANKLTAKANKNKTIAKLNEVALKQRIAKNEAKVNAKKRKRKGSL